VIPAALAALALAFLYAGRQYPLDSLASPGPGIFPLASGLALLLLAASQAIADAVRRRRPGGNPSAPGYRSPYQQRAPLFMAVLLAGYAAGVPVLGFLTASFLLVALAARLMGVEGWSRPALLAASVVLAVHAIFAAWLGVPLPTGMLR
jgi:Tripartite tricarboxylate transporter TctB family